MINLLIVISYVLIVVFLLGVLPRTYIKNQRATLAAYSVFIAQALGATTWLVSFLFVVKTFGGWGIFFAFLFQFLAPLAIVGAILKGSLDIAGHLSLWICFTYGMRFYSQWLLNLNPRSQEKSRIIDVDAVEVV